jgi:hypothetical protein
VPANVEPRYRSPTGRPGACSDPLRKCASLYAPDSEKPSRSSKNCVGKQSRDARIVRAAVFVIRVFHGQRDLACLVVERLAGHEIDGGTERAFVDGARGGLA